MAETNPIVADSTAPKQSKYCPTCPQCGTKHNIETLPLPWRMPPPGDLYCFQCADRGLDCHFVPGQISIDTVPFDSDEVAG